jgi:molecular chaperone GrpE (heat shock protein)
MTSRLARNRRAFSPLAAGLKMTQVRTRKVWRRRNGSRGERRGVLRIACCVKYCRRVNLPLDATRNTHNVPQHDCLRSTALSPNLYPMRDSTSVPVPRWPFFLGDATLFVVAVFIYNTRHAPAGHWEMITGALCIALGAGLAVWPFLLDHRERLKRLDADALGSVSEKIQDLERLATQISSATNDWKSVHLQAEKTSTTAKEISDRMASELRDFTAFMQKANDGEKANLRLEVEKLRRAEMDWLQALVHVLDHVHALHAGAVRSGKTGVIEQITQFRNACQEAVRRVGLVAYLPAPGDAFVPGRHQTAEGDAVPANAVVAVPLAIGFTLQGQVVRPAVVRVAKDLAHLAPPEPPDAGSPPPPAGQSQLVLEASVPT